MNTEIRKKMNFNKNQNYRRHTSVLIKIKFTADTPTHQRHDGVPAELVVK
jgi:hypothetical protein